MKREFLLSIYVLIITSCSSAIEEQPNPNHFESTTRVETYGDSVRIEYEEMDSLTINHYIELDSSGETTFINNTVTSMNRINQLKKDITRDFMSYKVGDYEIRVSGKGAIKDTNSVINHFIRKGEFKCYLGLNPQSQMYILERRIEGNGTYQNTLFLIEPAKGDSLAFFDWYDPWLTKSYSWDWKGLRPMTWDEYENKKPIKVLYDPKSRKIRIR